MALTLKFNTCTADDCTNLLFTETTGAYSVNNLTGYGTPNDNLSDFVSATLTITDPNGNSTTIDLFTQGFPTDNISSTYKIYATDLGLTAIQDGEWKFVYTLTDKADTLHTKTKYSLFYCNSECCVKQMLANLKLNECDCCDKDTDYDSYILAWTQLESLKNAARCGNTTLFTSIKKIVDKLCKNINCKTCK